MVSPFPPLRDGVGKYAAQEVAALRAEGHEVEVLAPVACAAQFVENFKTWSGGLAKLRGYAKRYDRVILQYQPAHFHWRGEGTSRMASNFWMMIAFRTIANLEIVCHEAEYGAPNWPNWRPEKFFDRMAWKGARHVEFHTEHEIAEMERRLGVRPKHTVIRQHGRYFKAATTEDKAQARAKLGVPTDVPVLLCIGFIQPHKGFDRALRAFRTVPGDAKLYVVGSISVEIPETRGYMNELLDLATTDDRIEVHERMVSDEEFDRWIIASDAVLLPYREIWSSGVLERARILDRPVIAAPAGGLVEQVRPNDVIVSSDEDLAHAISQIVGAGKPTQPEPMSIPEAIAFVEAESGLRREGTGAEGVDRAIRTLDASRGVHPVILPSQRPGIGRVLDFMKRVMRRGLGWLLTPILGQINEFERLTVEAMDALIAEQRGTDPSRYTQFDYDAFEMEFRGDPELLKDKLRDYVALYERGPVLDVGCGRGEFLELLAEAGIEGIGVDLSLDLVTSARAKGLKVDHGDGIAYLQNLKPSSLSGIMAAQVVEHMAPRALLDFMAAARRALRGSGIIVIETINPESLYALANWYTMDLTHAQPIHPRTLSFLAKQAGFEGIQIRYLSHARAPHEPLDIPDDAPAWAKTMGKTLDDEMSALNNTVFGAQDFALIARVR